VRFRERFLRESRLAASIDHPNVIPVYDAGEVGGELYIAMRFVEGSDLKQLLAAGSLESARAVAFVSQVAAALDAAHARGLVHRDVKPSNVLVTEDGHVYLADFGLTRRLGEAAAAFGSGHSLGTADYVAPEQIRGDEVDGRADLYSLGCLLYESLTGKPPFRRDSEVATLFAHLEAEPPAPTGLESVMRTALAKEPDSRYQSGRELVEAARSALGLEPKRARWPLAVAAVGVALLAASLLAFFLTSSGGGTPAEAGADSLVRVDPTANTVTKTIAVGRVAGGVAADSHAVWVTNEGDGTVWRIDPSSGRVLKLSAHGTPTGVVLGGGKAIVEDGPEHRIAVFDAESGVVDYVADLSGPGAFGELTIGAGDGHAWFGDPVGFVGKVDSVLANGTPDVQIAIPTDTRNLVSGYGNFDALAVGEAALWLAGDPFEHVVWRIDPRSERVAKTIRLPFIPKALAAGDGAVWVTSLLGDTVSRIDPRTDRIVATIPVGRGPDAIAVGRRAVWVSSAIDDSLLRIDPATNRVVARIRLEGSPRAVAEGAGGVWVTVSKPVPAVPKGTIGVGVYADCQGFFGSQYEDSLAGAALPLVERGGKPGLVPTDGVNGVSIGGHPIRLYFGCDPADGSSSTTQVLSEARRLVEQVGVQILIAPTTTPDELQLQPYAGKRPQTTFIDGAGLAPNPDPAHNYFKFNTDGAQNMAGLGYYAYHTLGWRHAVTFTLTDAYSWAEMSAFDAEFCSLGGTIAKRIWFPVTTNDFSGIAAQAPRRGVDGYVVDQAALLAALAKDDPWLHGKFARKVIVTTEGTYKWQYQLGARAAGIVSAGETLFLPGADARPGLAPGGTYRVEFVKAFPHLPKSLIGQFDVGYYNGMAATLVALGRVHGDLSGGEGRFMAALAKVTLDSPIGRVSLDSRHEGITPSYVWKLEGSHFRPHIIRTIPAVDPTFGGYFEATDPPPNESTPACVKRTPPPWAR
jgi:serine/threonine-protein kinase